MKRNLIMRLMAGIIIMLSLSSVHAENNYEGLQGPTETRYWDNTNSYTGYTLFGAIGRTSYLIDMEGHVVNTWDVGNNPRLLDYNGNLLDMTRGDVAGIIEKDWDGNIVWEYYETREDYILHHDFVRIFNKKLNEYTTLFIANKSITHDEAIAHGANPANGPYDGAQLDAIVEINMAGEVIWEWWFFDHTIQDFDSTKLNYVGTGKTIADYPCRININLPGKPLKRDWLHCNSVDYNSELGQIVVNSVHGEFYVIDHDNTFIPGDKDSSIALAASPLGDFLYRFGDPARYQQGDPPSILEDWTKSTTGHKQIGGSHDVQWIKPGIPGAGHFLIFNNGQYLFERTSQSYIFEVNGFLDADSNDTGNYVNPPDAGYWIWDQTRELRRNTHKLKKNMSRQISWIYYSKSNQGFFSHIGSGAQRLPNGNTLICAMTEGHIFEVMHDGTLVWEYVNPVTPEGIKEIIIDNPPMTNSVFRAYRYGPNHPALAGKDLTPKETITGKDPDYVTPDDLTDISEMKTPKLFKLNQNYPNPFNHDTVIPYQIIEPGLVKLTIFNIRGQEIKTLVNEHQTTGAYKAIWNGENNSGMQVSSGIYLCKLQINDHIMMRKMAYMK